MSCNFNALYLTLARIIVYVPYLAQSTNSGIVNHPLELNSQYIDQALYMIKVVSLVHYFLNH